MGLVLFLFVVGGFVVYFKGKHKNQKNWLHTPTLDHYWNLYPHCKTPEGTACYNCGSKHQRTWGIDSPSDTKRTHICHQCNTGLYRTGP